MSRATRFTLLALSALILGVVLLALTDPALHATVAALAAGAWLGLTVAAAIERWSALGPLDSPGRRV